MDVIHQDGRTTLVCLPSEMLAAMERGGDGWNPIVAHPELVPIAREIIAEGSLPARGHWNDRTDRPMFGVTDVFNESLRRFRATQATH